MVKSMCFSELQWLPKLLHQLPWVSQGIKYHKISCILRGSFWVSSSDFSSICWRCSCCEASVLFTSLPRVGWSGCLAPTTEAYLGIFHMVSSKATRSYDSWWIWVLQRTWKQINITCKWLFVAMTKYRWNPVINSDRTERNPYRKIFIYPFIDALSFCLPIFRSV